MDAEIIRFPYLWRFLKKNKLDAQYFDPANGNYIFSLSNGSSGNDPSDFISLEAFLELRPKKDGEIEDHVSLIWAGSLEMQNNKEHELLSAVDWIAKKFTPLPKHFSFARVAYLEVLNDIKNKRNNLIKFCNTQPVDSPPTHCGLWIISNPKKSDADCARDKLKIYNALVANSDIFCFKLDPDATDKTKFLIGTIENQVFTLNRNHLDAPPKKPVQLCLK